MWCNGKSSVFRIAIVYSDVTARHTHAYMARLHVAAAATLSWLLLLLYVSTALACQCQIGIIYNFFTCFICFHFVVVSPFTCTVSTVYKFVSRNSTCVTRMLSICAYQFYKNHFLHAFFASSFCTFLFLLCTFSSTRCVDFKWLWTLVFHQFIV